MTDASGEGPAPPPRGLDQALPESDRGILVRHEEEVRGTHGGGWRGVGYVKARSRIGRSRVDLAVAKAVERAELERVPVSEGDSQRIETLDDGSISIPVFEEELVVKKRVVLKERIVLRKRIETVTETVVDELRKERIEIEPDDSVRDRVRIPGGFGGSQAAGWHAFSPRPSSIETRPFWLTSEFGAALLAIVGITATAASTDAIGAWRAWILISAVVLGYFISRGLAKRGTPSHAADPRERWSLHNRTTRLTRSGLGGPSSRRDDSSLK
jgi:uncharacterized protein (TIGR02271 family)